MPPQWNSRRGHRNMKDHVAGNIHVHGRLICKVTEKTSTDLIPVEYQVSIERILCTL